MEKDTRIVTFGDLAAYSEVLKSKYISTADADDRYVLASTVGNITEDDIAAIV